MNEHSRLDDASFFPVPAALVTFLGVGGKVQLLPATWVSAICRRPLRLTVSFQSPLDAVLLPAVGADFAINLPAEQWRFAPSFLRYLREEELDLAAAYGLSLVTGGQTGVPLVAECPVQVECSRAVVRANYGRLYLSGEVVAVHTADQLFPPHPFLRTWRRQLFRPGGLSEGLLPA